jgi:hypothetical protein
MDPNLIQRKMYPPCLWNSRTILETAKDAVSGTVMLPPEEGYNKAKSILREMFRQTHIVAASHIDRVTKGGTIKEFKVRNFYN